MAATTSLATDPALERAPARASKALLWAGHSGLAATATGVLALVLRLLHVRFTARLLVADDAVFFQQHAEQFLSAWRAAGTAEFWPLLREAIDHASLQGVPYPLFQSLVFLATGGINHTALALVQAVLGGATAALTYATARRAFGPVAGVVAGVFVAVYPPLVLAAGLLLAETLLIFVQTLALYLLVRGLEPGGSRARFAGGACIGLLMLRPAFQYAGPLLCLALLFAGLVSARGRSRRVRAALAMALPYAAGVLLVAVPWVTLNGVVYGQFVWSRTGDAWQQVYWGIYPPNRGWWPPDSPVPPKYGVESLPGARAAGRTIEVRDLDYLEAAVAQVRATPLKAAATEVNKLYQAFLHPFDVFRERPALVGGLAVPLHRAAALLALLGVSLAWWRPAASAVLAAGWLAVSLPFLASHIDVRYTVPVAAAGAPFAGLGAALLGRLARRRRAAAGALALCALPAAAWAGGVPWILAVLPGVPARQAHLAHATAVVLATLVASAGLGWRLRRSRPFGLDGRRVLVSVAGAGSVVALMYGTQALYDGDWHQWSTVLRPGDEVRQTLVLPAAWQPPAGGRAELRLYLAGARGEAYSPVLRVNGREAHRLGPGLTEIGPLRFWDVILAAAGRQGIVRAEMPQWIGLALDRELWATDRLEVSLAVEPGPPEASGPEPWLRVWGDYPPEPGARVYEGPALYSRIQGADEAFLKYVATGEYGIWRRTPLRSTGAAPARRSGDTWRADDLSAAPGRQTGEYRIRLLVFGPAGDLLAVY